VDPGRVWFFEQKQGIGLGLNVSVNVRMTVIKLRSGGLWVHAPIAPTDECIALLNELDAPVEHIVLPTTLFEHKIFVGPFQRRFPNAIVFIAPDQVRLLQLVLSYVWAIRRLTACFVYYSGPGR